MCRSIIGFLTLLVFATILVFPTVAAVEARSPRHPTFKKDTLYSTARARLVQSGWRPAKKRKASECEEGDDLCKRYPEMRACAGTGEGNCLFCWKKGGYLIIVTTVYDPPLVDAVEPRASCP